MDFGMGTGASFSATAATAAAPEDAASSLYHLYGLPSADTLRVNDLLGFSGRDLFPVAHVQHYSTNPFSASGNQSFAGEANSSPDFQSKQSCFDFDIPCEEEAELQWLSQFVEDSFSDVPYQYGGLAIPSCGNKQLHADQCVAGRAARSKRPSIGNPAAAARSPLTPPAQPSPSSSSSSSDLPIPRPNSIDAKKEIGGGSSSRGKKCGGEMGVRRCTHCASEKTPQWRRGPLGPKTLCNACGVRYKSGRLLPEYRPAASPTYVLTQHSNSHRKVMELRRQKELLRHHDNKLSSASAAAARPELLIDDKSVC